MIKTLHNLTRIVFCFEELDHIAIFLKPNYPEATILADEISCGFLYGSKNHTMIVSLPDMWSTSVTLFSFGKVYMWPAGEYVSPSDRKRSYLLRVPCSSARILACPCCCLQKRSSRKSIQNNTKANQIISNGFVVNTNRNITKSRVS